MRPTRFRVSFAILHTEVFLNSDFNEIPMSSKLHILSENRNLYLADLRAWQAAPFRYDLTAR